MQTVALADVHGNVHALEAVLADPRVGAADRIVVLGDTVAGTFAAEVYESLRELGERVRILRGNADRIVLDEDGEEPRWVRDRLGPDRLAAVRAWPEGFAIEVQGLGPVRCCHATPTSDEEVVTYRTPDEDVAAVLATAPEPVVLGGHTHAQFDRSVDGRRFVNVGSVGRPYEGRPGAYWALLGPDVEHVRTEYDVEAAAKAVLDSGQPRAEEIAELLLHPPTPDEVAAEWEAIRGAK